MNQPITDAISAFLMPTGLSSPQRSVREEELDSHTTNHDAAIDREGAQSLVSDRLQQLPATSLEDTEEDLENVEAPEIAPSSQGQKRKRNDSHGSKVEHTLSKLEREEVHVEGVIRQTIRKTSLMLSEDINDLALVYINGYMNILSKLVRALEALQSTE